VKARVMTFLFLAENFTSGILDEKKVYLNENILISLWRDKKS